MTSIESLTLEVADTAAANRFYTAFGLGAQVGFAWEAASLTTTP